MEWYNGMFFDDDKTGRNGSCDRQEVGGGQ